jgi:hypothetical protein
VSAPVPPAVSVKGAPYASVASVRPFSSTAEARCQPSPRVPVQPTESGREYSTPPCLDYRGGGKEKREREKREKRKESEFFCFAE